MASGKPRIAIKCAFCGGTRFGKSDLEVQVRLVEATGLKRQLFGAHVSCMNDAMADGYEIELDALQDEAAASGPELRLVERAAPALEQGDGER